MKRLRIIGLACVALLSVFAYRKWQAAQWRTPTPTQLRAAFPAAARDIFAHADQMTLLSLDAHAGSEAVPMKEAVPGKVEFHGYVIRGETMLRDAAVRRNLMGAFDDGLARAQFRAACFGPRHGVHAVKGKHSLDLVICFGCYQFQRFYDGRLIGGDSIAINPAPLPTFDGLLTEAGVPIEGSKGE